MKALGWSVGVLREMKALGWVDGWMDGCAVRYEGTWMEYGLMLREMKALGWMYGCAVRYEGTWMEYGLML